ncbi:shikimate dehydrogenase [Sphaerimonospora thailandensis]|uniref:Shikimate 5-dehydrogenase n=1 Tax=Sphaerimonospora thailandensis TaxID=795644 RepID=A0A8J3R7I9_9ACTN|nr:shikimate dehydrogenase [Sphaerimonospora thailandensis]GIH70781.1 shikimate 5-dehydrogenase [Sphaerimonospora thailandensis]
MTAIARRAAVLGSPIAHSLSPVLHRAAYAGLGLRDWRYDAIECDEDGLAGLLATMGPEWAGLSLTMPLKRAVLPLLDTVSDLAEAVGGANTVVFRDGGFRDGGFRDGDLRDGDLRDGGARHGENTDVYGIVAALNEAGVSAPAGATVLGGGATAASAIAALRELGLTEVALVVRDPARAGETLRVAERLGMAVTVSGFDRFGGDRAGRTRVGELVISTLPSGAADRLAREVAAALPHKGALFDVVYSPWPTPLATAVRDRGLTVVGGFPMLLHQAVRQVELMTGRDDVPVEAMRVAGEAEIARRIAGRAG